MRNPFAVPTKEELEARLREKKEIEKRIKETIELGKKCLAHEDFTKYRKQLEKDKDEIVKAMIKTVSIDPVQDAFFLRTCLSKLDALYMLIDYVEGDSRKKEI